MNKKELGDIGETLAIQYVQSKGYKILSKNFRCKFGEIDIIAKYKNFYVFIEVKTRKNLIFGRPIEAVNSKKIAHMLKTIRFYLKKNNISNADIRIDAIEIILIDLKNYKINHLENIYYC